MCSAASWRWRGGGAATACAAFSAVLSLVLSNLLCFVSNQSRSAASWRWRSCSGRWCPCSSALAPGQAGRVGLLFGGGSYAIQAQQRRACKALLSCLAGQQGRKDCALSMRSVLPPSPGCHLAFGSPFLQFVFRQGSPLDPAALRNVAAPDARRIIVCSDHRCAWGDFWSRVACSTGSAAAPPVPIVDTRRFTLHPSAAASKARMRMPKCCAPACCWTS